MTVLILRRIDAYVQITALGGTKMQKTYILVHGAWLGAWCWDMVKPYLEAEGHKVIAELLR